MLYYSSGSTEAGPEMWREAKIFWPESTGYPAWSGRDYGKRHGPKVSSDYLLIYLIYKITP
jgi:hypothetical protein